MWPAAKIDKDYRKGRSKMKIGENSKMYERRYRKRKEEKQREREKKKSNCRDNRNEKLKGKEGI